MVGGETGEGAEQYDLASNAWSAADPLAAVRMHHSATLLPSGQVLLAGGHDDSDLLSSAEVYEPTGAQDSWRPAIDSMPTVEAGTTELLVTGTRFTGVSEASDGRSWNSASNVPVLALRRLDQETSTNLEVRSFTGTAAMVAIPPVPSATMSSRSPPMPSPGDGSSGSGTRFLPRSRWW